MHPIKCFIGVIAGLSLMASVPAAAQDKWPSKIVRIVVPFAAGGSTDLIARQIAQDLGERIKGTVIVDNRPGAGGTIGSEYVSKLPADGYTLLMGSVSTHAVAPSIYAKLRYDPIKDFTPLTMVATIPNVMVVHPSLPVNSVKELVELSKKQPGSISFASNGNGTSNHLAAELFKNAAGAQMIHTPYKGSGPAMLDLLGGHVNMMLDVIMTSYPAIKNGKLKALAVTSPGRSSLLPDVPTVAESGYPGFEAIVWFGLFAPPHMPAALQNRISNDLIAVLQSKKMKDYLNEQGAQVTANTPAQFSDAIAVDIVKWQKVVKAAGVLPE